MDQMGVPCTLVGIFRSVCKSKIASVVMTTIRLIHTTLVKIKYTIEICVEHYVLLLNYFRVNEFILRWIFIFAINWPWNLKIMTPFDRCRSDIICPETNIVKIAWICTEILHVLYFSSFNNGCHGNRPFSQNAQWCQLGITRILDVECPGMHNLQKKTLWVLSCKVNPLRCQTSMVEEIVSVSWHIDCEGRKSRSWNICPGHSTSL